MNWSSCVCVCVRACTCVLHNTALKVRSASFADCSTVWDSFSVSSLIIRFMINIFLAKMLYMWCLFSIALNMEAYNSSCFIRLSLISGFRCYMSDPLIIMFYNSLWNSETQCTYILSMCTASLTLPQKDQDLPKIATIHLVYSRRYSSVKEFISFHLTEVKGKQNVPCAGSIWACWLMRSYMVSACRVEMFVMSFFSHPQWPPIQTHVYFREHVLSLKSMHFMPKSTKLGRCRYYKETKFVQRYEVYMWSDHFMGVEDFELNV